MLRMDCTAVTSSDVPPVDPLSSEADEQPISAAARVSAIPPAPMPRLRKM
jgi:hypothetical protein